MTRQKGSAFVRINLNSGLKSFKNSATFERPRGTGTYTMAQTGPNSLCLPARFLTLTVACWRCFHSQVPHTYAENPPLARWVKRQRYQYKLKIENKQSTMTDERIIMLENIGFIWDSHAAAWEEKLNELKEYTQLRGNWCVTHEKEPKNGKKRVDTISRLLCPNKIASSFCVAATYQVHFQRTLNWRRGSNAKGASTSYCGMAKHRT